MVGNDHSVQGNDDQVGQNWKRFLVQRLDDLKGTVKKVQHWFYEKLGNDYMKLFNASSQIWINFPPYLKIYIAYFQITGSFLTFGVTWPPLLKNMMLWVKSTLFLDILTLPGLSCFWQGVDFKFKLLAYTLVPLGVIAILLLPVGYYWILLWIKNDTPTIRVKLDAAVSSAYKNIMFWLFLIYPVVSLTTLLAFDCRPSGLNKLAADVNEPCPENGSFLRIWSIIFIWVYPVGIPAFCYVVMLGMGVHLIAQDIQNQELLRGLATKYIQCTGKSSQKVLALIYDTQGTVDPAKIEEVYNFFFENGTLSHNTNSNLSEKKIPNSDADTQLLKEYIALHSFQAEANVSLKDFKLMLRASFATQDLMANIEAGCVTKEQAISLLLFDFKRNWKLPDSTMNLMKTFQANLNSPGPGDVVQNEIKLQMVLNKRKYLMHVSKNKECSWESSRLLGKELLKLAKNLKDDNIITVHTVSWSESMGDDTICNPQQNIKDRTEMKIPNIRHRETFAIHPELPDDDRWNFLERTQNFIGFFPTNERYKCAEGRKELKDIAMSRAGFIFSSYKAKFWFWELLEMLRK